MPPKILEEPFMLTDDDPNITEADGVANTWSDIWDYEVPEGVAHRITADHTFSLYLEDTSPAQVGDQTCRVRVEIRDPSGQDIVYVYGPALYKLSKEFTERPLMAHLSGAWTIEPRYHIVVVTNDDGTIDASDSYFNLHIARVRQSLVG